MAGYISESFKRAMKKRLNLENITIPWDTIALMKDGKSIYEWDLTHLRLREGDSINLKLTKPLQVNIEVR